MRYFGLVALFLMFSSQLALAAAPSRPTLVVTIVVDQYSADLFGEYRALYKDGLATLSKGVVFPHGYQSHSATETCPGHSTILTGMRPARTGIIANDWQDPAHPSPSGTHSRYCIEEVNAQGARVLSLKPLLVPTLGERLRAADPNSRTVAIGGKDRAAMMLSGGSAAYLTLWWTGSKGPQGTARFATYAGTKVEPAMHSRIDEINAQVQAAYRTEQKPRLPAECKNRTRAVKVGEKLTVGELRDIPAGETGRWRGMATLDRLTLKMAVAAIETLQLGKKGSIDVLAVSFSATDYVGHYYGTEGPEMCAQQVALDEIIQELLSHLDETGVSYVVALTADHGGLDIPERNGSRGVRTARRIDPKLVPENLGKAVADELGLRTPVLLGGRHFANDVYLAPAVRNKRAAVIKALRRHYEDNDQVEKVFTRKELLDAKPPSGSPDRWTLLDRAKASFNEQRSGDLVVFLKPYVTHYGEPHDIDGDYISSHGSPWDYDRRVPILFWWHGIEGFEQPAAIETVDIAPTLADLLGVKPGSPDMDGRVLQIGQGAR